MKFSIIMPVYNSEREIIRSITSIQKQTLNNWELIAIDDGSTDDSLSLLKKISREDKRISMWWRKNKIKIQIKLLFMIDKSKQCNYNKYGWEICKCI